MSLFSGLGSNCTQYGTINKFMLNHRANDAIKTPPHAHTVTIHPYLSQRPKKGRSIPLLPLLVVMACSRANLTFFTHILRAPGLPVFFFFFFAISVVEKSRFIHVVSSLSPRRMEERLVDMKGSCEYIE